MACDRTTVACLSGVLFAMMLQPAAAATGVAGIRIAEHRPEVAQVADKLAIIRSKTSLEPASLPPIG